MEAADTSRPEDVPRIYASWRRRTLVGAIVASAVGLGLHGPTGEVRFDFGGERPPIGMLIGVAALVIGVVGPGLAGTCCALAAILRWRRLRASSRWTRAAWIVWVLGPLPVLLVPVSFAFGLEPESSWKTSAHQVRQLLVVTTPALFALLPGILRSALVLERFLPESRAPGQITLLAAPVCTVAYLLPLAALAQLAFQWGLYLGLLLLAASPLVPLMAARRLLRRDTPARARRLVRAIVAAQGVLVALGAALLIAWAEGHPLLQSLIGRVDAAWLVGFASKVMASKWLTEVVVTDLLLAMMHQDRESARSLEKTPEGEALARKLDALGHALRPGGASGA